MQSEVYIQSTLQDSAQVSEAKSLAIVRSFLNAAVASIAHTRELIPWNSACFKNRQVNRLNFDSDNVDGILKGIKEAGERVQSSQEFRILRRGKDKRADSILDMIDGGVTDALQRSYLDAFQLIIAVETKDPASILESYTFSFTYSEGSISQINISPRGNNTFTVNNAQRSFSISIQSLLKSMTGLPRLPRHRSLGIALLYNQTCPQSYQPTGFVDAEKNYQVPLRGCWTDVWQNLPSPVVRFFAGHHKIAIGVQNLQHKDRMRCSQLQDVNDSKTIQMLQKTSPRNGEVTSTIAPLPSTIAHEATVAHQNGLVGSHDLLACPQQNIELPNKFVQPNRNRPQASIKPKTSNGAVNGLSKLGVASKSRRRRNVVASKLSELIVQAQALENTYKGSNVLFDKAQLHNGKIKRLSRLGPVQCECGSRHEVANMLFCELCGTRQHKVCYGWETLRAGCLPEEHFCYNCLLLPREDKQSEAMPGVVHMRLALFFLARQPNAEVEIGEEFRRAVFSGRDDAATPFTKLVDKLSEEGYIRKDNNRIAYIQEIDNSRLLDAQHAYLDPLAAIIHHYQVVRDGDTPEKRKQEILRELRLYIGDRMSSIDNHTNSHYDRIHVRNNTGQEVIRWGFYATWKRRRVQSPGSSQLRQKTSVSNEFVNINRSTPSEGLSMGQVMPEVVEEAQWTLRLSSRLSSADTNFN